MRIDSVSIVGCDHLSEDALLRATANGGRFVVYVYCISLLVVTLHRTSDVYLIRSDEGAISRGWAYTLLSLCLGWWGIPWGLVLTPRAILTNFGGGIDVTAAVIADLQSRTDEPSATSSKESTS